MQDCSFALHMREFSQLNVSGIEPTRHGNTSPIGYPFDVFRCKNGAQLALAAVKTHILVMYCIASVHILVS